MRCTSGCCAVAVLASIGCNDPHQGAWLDLMISTRTEVDDNQRYEGLPIAEHRLLDIAGEPDLRIPVEALIDALEGDRDYASYVNDQLQAAFERYKSHIVDRESSQPGPNSLSDCTIWAYDESKRFRRPYWTSAKVGYSAYLFVIWDSHVIGAASVHAWRCREAPEEGG